MVKKKKKVKNWMAEAFPEKTKGALHRDLGIPENEKIGKKRLRAAAKRGGKIGKRAQAALNANKKRGE